MIFLPCVLPGLVEAVTVLVPVQNKKWWMRRALSLLLNIYSA